jgi:hypothetical protein
MLMTQTNQHEHRRFSPFVRTLALLAVIGSGPSACAPVRYVEAFAPQDGVQKVVVRSESGNVELVAGTALWVERSIRAPTGSLELSHKVDDATLVLDARCRAWLPCPVDVRLIVPEGVAVVVELGEGEVWASDIGDLSVELGDGTADLNVTETLRATVGVGDIEVSLDAGGRAQVAVGDGNINVNVPHGPWRLQANGAAVHTEGIETVEEAAGSLELTAPSGRISVVGGNELALR